MFSTPTFDKLPADVQFNIADEFGVGTSPSGLAEVLSDDTGIPRDVLYTAIIENWASQNV